MADVESHCVALVGHAAVAEPRVMSHIDLLAARYSTAGTPDAVLARLQEVLPGVLASPAIRELTAKQGSVVDYAPAVAFAAQIAREIELDKVVVKRLGMVQQ